MGDGSQPYVISMYVVRPNKNYIYFLGGRFTDKSMCVSVLIWSNLVVFAQWKAAIQLPFLLLVDKLTDR